jgi:YidC/Oxa1 family membrane protein insertase
MWNFITSIYNTAIYEPILNLLVWMYNLIPGQDMGIVIIIVTLIIRFILAPLMHKSMHGQKEMSKLQPKLAEIREKHKHDKAEQSKALTEFYKENNVNPFASCLPILIQLPILIALYHVFSKALTGNLEGLYPFVFRPEILNHHLLGIVDLTNPNIWFAILAGLAQFWQSWMMYKVQQKQGNQDATMKAMSLPTLFIMPALSIYIAWKLPAGLPLYWIVTTLFAIGQQYYFNRKNPSDPEWSANIS